MTCLGLVVLFRAFWTVGSGKTFWRQRVERWAFAVGWILSLVEVARTSDLRADESLPVFDTMLVSSFLIIALVLAIPGAVVEVARKWRALAGHFVTGYRRIRDRSSVISGQDAE